MTEASPNAPLATRLEEQLAEAGFQVVVENSDGSLIMSGIVDTEEARQAAEDIASQVAPNARIDNQLQVETILPTSIDDFASDNPSADVADSAVEIAASGEELEPDFMDRPVLTDPVEAAGADSWGPEDVASSGEVYTPPNDPVVTSDAHGQTRMLGGFDTDDEVLVDVSSDGRPGDEALADAVRRELAEDSATTDLTVVVAVRNGVAHLRGQVADLDDAENAEAVAARVPGIREVVEEIEVANL